MGTQSTNGNDVGPTNERIPSEQVRRQYPRLKDLVGSGLRTPDLVTFAALCDFANPNAEMWPVGALKTVGFAAWPSVKTLERITGLSDRGVQLSLKRLEAAGAIQCLRRTKGGGFQRPDGSARANTNCYLLTPNAVHREGQGRVVTANAVHPHVESSPNGVHSDSSKSRAFTQQDSRSKGEYRSEEARMPFTPEGESHSPKEANHRQEEETNEGAALHLSSDDDRTAKRLPQSDDPIQELALRFRERFGSGADALLQIVLDGISPKRQEVQDFVDFDGAHTGAPQDLTNPGGYYRTLVVRFQLAQSNRRERERLYRQFQLEHQMATPPPPSPVCPVGRCNGRGEVYETSGRITVCECEAGRRLPSNVRDLIDQLATGAA